MPHVIRINVDTQFFHLVDDKVRAYHNEIIINGSTQLHLNNFLEMGSTNIPRNNHNFDTDSNQKGICGNYPLIFDS